MRHWGWWLGAALAAGAAAVVIGVAVRQSASPDPLEEISDILDDCHDRIRRLESELRRLKPTQAPAA